MAEPCPILPDHVIEDIFARLPPKSVHRCRCLSHAWAATLSSDDFVDHHLRLANRYGGPRILLLQDSTYHGPQMHAWSPDHPGGTTLVEVPHALTCDPPLVIAFRGVVPTDTAKLVPRLVTQQCRGLVILEATVSKMYYVFNPSTGQMAALPEGRPTGCRRPTESYHKYASLGLGYDMCTRKHKVVRIYYRGSSAEKLPETAGCEVYVINSTGLWRPAESGAREKPLGWVYPNETSVFAQGHVHWLTQRKLDSRSEEMFIVSFSLDDETFGIVPPPLDSERKGLLKHYLTELGGRLCLFCTDIYNSQPCRYDVWLLRGHETGTWDLHCRINLDMMLPKVAIFMKLGNGINPLAIIDNGRRILLIRPRFPLSGAPSFKMCAYAPVTGDIENLLDGRGLLSHRAMVLRHAALYEESIASPGQPYEDIIFAMSLVLRRLSADTLARLKCVCRSWRSMIESDRFGRARHAMSPFGFIF